MTPGALRALEFDRIVAVVTGLAVTPPGRSRLAAMHPATDAAAVIASQRATSEGARFLADHSGFPLKAPTGLEAILENVRVEGRALEPLQLLGLSEFLESIERSRASVRQAGAAFPILERLVSAAAAFTGEIAGVRRAIDPAGDVADHATPLLASLRGRLRKQRATLRSTLESFLRGRDTAKYLQDQVVTDRNGRYVLVLRAEHRGAIPGIVHGASTSGASLFLEPLATVEVNNDIVALEEQEAEEVHRILLALSDAFRARPDDLARTVGVAAELDAIQARARFSQIVDGVEPGISADGTVELRGARHPLLMRAVHERLDSGRPDEGLPPDGARRTDPVPVDILLVPPARILVVTGPNTGGKTVAIKTAGLLAAMAQAGLHIPADPGSRLPVFRSLFADIGDEQSISASLSTFSAHITNVVSMDRGLALPALVLLDEVGAGTDPAEGGALGTAVIDHFRRRGAHLIATTHYDSLKSYASTTEHVVCAAFGFNRETFAPTYRLVYGAPGRSLAIEIAARLGMPPSVVAAARANLSEREQQLAEHLARVDRDLGTLERDRRALHMERAQVTEAEKQMRVRESTVREREETFTRRLNAKLDDQVREARREIDHVIEGLKAKAAALPRLRPGLTTGDTGAARAEARAALDAVAARARGAGRAGGVSEAGGADPSTLPASLALPAPPAPPALLAPGVRVSVGGLGLEGEIIEIHGKHAEVDVRGKRLRSPLRDLRAIAGPAASARVRVNVDLQPRQGSLSELNVIGCTVDEAIARAEKFLDESTMTDQQTLRIIHGHGTGQLRRAIAEFLKNHPLVARFELAPQDQGGGGATMVELKD